MKIDGGFGAANPTSLSGGLTSIGASAKRLEDEGYAGAWTAETSHDPFLPHVIAAEHTERLELGTAIAVAFARNPMILAQIGHDLQRYSDGRFIMGLGTQIRPHITKRFSMEWSQPAARMREFVSAMQAIWDCWNNGTKLGFRGDFYTHTLMTPFFNPGPNECGPPKVFISAVGPLMSEVAGEVCDGVICHAFSTETYLREVTLPRIEAGLAKSGRTTDDFEIIGPGFVVTGPNEEAMAKAATGIRQQIAFYASTPAYLGVLEIHGWEGLHGDLNAMSKRGEWQAMGDLIDDEVLDAFAVVAEPDKVATEIRARYGDCVDRMMFYALGGDHGADFWMPIVADLAT